MCARPKKVGSDTYWRPGDRGEHEAWTNNRARAARNNPMLSFSRRRKLHFGFRSYVTTTYFPAPGPTPPRLMPPSFPLFCFVLLRIKMVCPTNYEDMKAVSTDCMSETRCALSRFMTHRQPSCCVPSAMWRCILRALRHSSQRETKKRGGGGREKSRCVWGRGHSFLACLTP